MPLPEKQAGPVTSAYITPAKSAYSARSSCKKIMPGLLYNFHCTFSLPLLKKLLCLCDLTQYLGLQKGKQVM